MLELSILAFMFLTLPPNLRISCTICAHELTNAAASESLLDLHDSVGMTTY